MLAACTGDAPAPTPEPTPCSDCQLTDANNYRWSSQLTAASFSLTQGQDATLDWSALTVDMFGLPLDPVADVDQVALLALPGLTPDQVAAGLATDSLTQSDAALFVFCTPVDARCQLSDFELFGNGLQVETYFLAGSGTWLAALMRPEGTIASVAFLLPAAGAWDPLVLLDDDSARLDVDLALHGLEPVVVPLGEDFAVDWGGLTVDGLGNPMSTGTIDRLLVGRFDAAPDDLQALGGALLHAAEETWSVDVQSTGEGTMALQGDSLFPGVGSASTWLLALECSSCLNPAPRFLTRLVGSSAAPDAPP